MTRSATAFAVATVIMSVGLAVPANASLPAKYANCTNLSKYYPHGVGRSTAHDRVAAGAKPVTTWKHDTTAYNTAMRYNRGLDRDKDYIACERR